MRKTLVNLMAGILLSYSSTAVAAQGDSNNPTLAAIQSLRTDVTAAFDKLGQSLNSIQTTLSSLTQSAQSTVAMTLPFVYETAGGAIVCSVGIKATQNRTVEIQIIVGNTLRESSLVTLGPGQSTSLGVTNLAESGAFCRFTVRDGTTADIAAGATQFVGGQIVGVVNAQ